jgi:hypothetical protein
MNDPEFQNIYEVYQPKMLRYLARLVGEAESVSRQKTPQG